LGVGNNLTCVYGDLAKGATREVRVSAVTSRTDCPAITNQAIAEFDDGTGDVTSRSPIKNITVRCN